MTDGEKGASAPAEGLGLVELVVSSPTTEGAR